MGTAEQIVAALLENDEIDPKALASRTPTTLTPEGIESLLRQVGMTGIEVYAGMGDAREWMVSGQSAGRTTTAEMQAKLQSVLDALPFEARQVQRDFNIDGLEFRSWPRREPQRMSFNLFLPQKGIVYA